MSHGARGAKALISRHYVVFLGVLFLAFTLRLDD